MLVQQCDNARDNKWPQCDSIAVLIRDLKSTAVNKKVSKKAEKMLLSTLLPLGLSEFMEASYQHTSLPEKEYLHEPRVLNNPYFYQEKNASYGRLVEFAAEGGRYWTLDRAKPMPTPDVLAEEIALLCFAMKDRKRVISMREALLETITEQMEIFGLIPNLFP